MLLLLRHDPEGKGEDAQLPQGVTDSATTPVVREKLQRECKCAPEEVDDENVLRRTINLEQILINKSPRAGSN